MQRNAGFTLIEMLITVAVLSILAAIAYPSYQDQVRKSRRAEAQSLLMDIGTRQQQRLLDVRSYAASTAELNVNMPSSVRPHYTITMVAPAIRIPVINLVLVSFISVCSVVVLRLVFYINGTGFFHSCVSGSLASIVFHFDAHYKTVISHTVVNNMGLNSWKQLASQEECQCHAVSGT